MASYPVRIFWQTKNLLKNCSETKLKKWGKNELSPKQKKKTHYFSNVDYVNHYIYITSKSTLRGKRKKERKKEKTPTNQFGDGRLSKIKVSL